jgi:hypothetical protein
MFPMKKLYLISFLLIPFYVFAQQGEQRNNSITTSKGFVNGLPLDSISSKFAQIEIDPSSRSFDLLFRYTEEQMAFGDLLVKDSKGRGERFMSIAAALNYLDQNGWTYLDKLNSAGLKMIILLTKK